MGDPLPVFSDKTIFVTGGSGFVGSVLASKLILRTSCKALIILCRGGQSRLFKLWQDTLPAAVVKAVITDPRIHVVDGDICQVGLGLQNAAKVLMQEVNIVFHAASTINLKRRLDQITQSVIFGSLNVANVALQCPSLERFIYVSTAYANAYLHEMHDGVETAVGEKLYNLPSEGTLETAEAEWVEVQKLGTSAAYEASPFPWAYGYAKHLSERLLTNMFDSTTSENDSAMSAQSDRSILCKSRLLIVRPSIIGPAVTFPAEDWHIATSAPVTAFAAALSIHPARHLNFSSRFPDPGNQSIIDEVPVDIVVNRMIMHASMGNSGVVHAVSGPAHSHTVNEVRDAIAKLRQLPWTLDLSWKNVGWSSPTLCTIANLYRVTGTAYNFQSCRSRQLWATMTESERAVFDLFPSRARVAGTTFDANMSVRSTQVKQIIAMMLKRQHIPVWFIPLLHKSSSTTTKSDGQRRRPVSTGSPRRAQSNRWSVLSDIGVLGPFSVMSSRQPCTFLYLDSENDCTSAVLKGGQKVRVMVTSIGAEGHSIYPQPPEPTRRQYIRYLARDFGRA